MKTTYYPVAKPSTNQPTEEPPMLLDDVTLLDEVAITAKGHKPFRDKYMGHLDSLAQKDLGPWVCEHGWLENYIEGYTHHHDFRYCPTPYEAIEHNHPVIGKRYHILKAEYYYGSDGKLYFHVIDDRYVVYQVPYYSDEELLRMNNLWRVKGYYGNREFYQPDELEIRSSIPDARNTLLWAPSVITDENGEATVSFYCSDVNTRFIGRIEGVDGAGLLGVGECEFRVIKSF
jgi:hypothetical protein